MQRKNKVCRKKKREYEYVHNIEIRWKRKKEKRRG